MPFMPFHFGPGGAVHTMAPERVSFRAFRDSNVLIDIKPHVLHANGAISAASLLSYIRRHDTDHDGEHGVVRGGP